MSLQSILGGIAGLVLGVVMTGLVMKGHELVAVHGAIVTTTNAQRVICNARVAEIERAMNAAVDEATDRAVAAADSLEATPDAAPDLVALCKRSASCRSRGSLP